MTRRILTGPLLIPRDGGVVDFYADGAMLIDSTGLFEFVGRRRELPACIDAISEPTAGVVIPPFVDIHTHIPQHPIRGRFIEGVDPNAPGGPLLNGLMKNVFPAERKWDEVAEAEACIEQFIQDSMSHGVVGGAAYTTVAPASTARALELAGPLWHAGVVLMNQNCPTWLRTDEESIEADLKSLAARFGPRLIVTDRFAVAVNRSLRRHASRLAGVLGLRTQTHLNEQAEEKAFVEGSLYRDARHYTDVYHADGLLDHRCIVAHCIQMSADEWSVLRQTGSVIAHCPTSNLLLGSGVMSLDDVVGHHIEYALATDVGASPTVSMLSEMARFLAVHRSVHATPCEALYRSTLAPARILGIDQQVGRMEAGRPASYVELEADLAGVVDSDAAVRRLLPTDLDRPTRSICRVTIAGRVVYHRANQ
jgi:guanine deaminase